MWGVVVLAILGWIGFLATVGIWGYRIYTWQPAPEPVTPILDDWHIILEQSPGQVVSIRRAKDGQFSTRIHRGHGRMRDEWFKLTAVRDRSLIYTPDGP